MRLPQKGISGRPRGVTAPQRDDEITYRVGEEKIFSGGVEKATARKLEIGAVIQYPARAMLKSVVRAFGCLSAFARFSRGEGRSVGELAASRVDGGGWGVRRMSSV